MAFLGSIGKALGGITKNILPVAAPIAATAFTGSPTAGLIAGQAFGGGGVNTGGLMGNFGTQGYLPGIPQSFPVQQFGQYGQFPTQVQEQQPVVMVKGPTDLVPFTQDIFNAVQKLLNRFNVPQLGLTIPRMKAIARKLLAAMIRFARLNPALSLISMLVSFGLTADEAYKLLTWFGTKRRRRRMNSGNAKALRRALRRVESFQRLCARAGAVRRGIPTSRRRRHCPRCRRASCICVPQVA